MIQTSPPRLRCAVVVRTIEIHTPAPAPPPRREPAPDLQAVPDRRLSLRVEVLG